jgi:MFS family permease
MVYDLGGEQSIGALTGLYYFSSSAAAITGPIIGGWIIDVAGHSAIWPFSAVSLLAAAILMAMIKTQPKPAS